MEALPQETSIIWEWRQGLLHETSEIVESLLAEIEKLQAENQTLRSLIKSQLLLRGVLYP